MKVETWFAKFLLLCPACRTNSEYLPDSSDWRRFVGLGVRPDLVGLTVTCDTCGERLEVEIAEIR